MSTMTPERYARKIQLLLDRSGVSGAPARSLPLHQAYGHILATDIVAVVDSPRFSNSQMDGFALSAEQLERGSGIFTVGQEIAAGANAQELYPHGLKDPAAVTPVMTGAALPEGAAAVIPVEDCSPGRWEDINGSVEIQVMPSFGQFVRYQGEDSRVGDVLVSAPSRVTPLVTAVAAAQGLSEVSVRRRPQVLLISGGDEVVSSPMQSVGPGQLWDSNGPMLSALCAEYGIDVAGRLSISDDAKKTRREIDQFCAAHEVDLIISSGGISKGTHEVLRGVLEAAEDSWIGTVDQQPGGPQAHGMLGAIPIICLPGNPLSTLVSFRLFIAPLLGDAPAPLTARVAEDYRGLPGRDRFARARWVERGASRYVTEVSGQGSHLLSQAAESNCLLRIPAGKHLQTGDPAQIYPLPNPCVHSACPPPEGLVVTVSTRAAQGVYEDATGPLLVQFLRELGLETPDPVVVPDSKIVDYLAKRADDGLPRVLLTTGGTGVTPDDQTVEALTPYIETPMPGVVQAYVDYGLRNTPLAALSRAIAGCTTAGFAMTLPGSKGAVRDGIEVLRELIPHILRLRERTAVEAAAHSCCAPDQQKHVQGNCGGASG